MARMELAIYGSRVADLRWLPPLVIDSPLPCCSHHPTAEVCANICTVGVSQIRLLLVCQGVCLTQFAVSLVRYFSFMALQSLPGNDFWERIILMVTDPKLRYR